MAIRSKLFDALRRTRKTLNTPISELIRKKISIETLDDLENQLLANDMGIGTTDLIINKLSGSKADDPTVLIRNILLEQLPIKEKLLSDKQEHIVRRNNFDYELYKQNGFKAEVPQHLYIVEISGQHQLSFLKTVETKVKWILEYKPSRGIRAA